MASSLVKCTYCHKDFLKDNRYINENIKLGYKSYCSRNCEFTYKSKKKEFICENKPSNKKFIRKQKDISPHNFCSRSCAIIVNNVRFPRKSLKIRKCVYCSNRIFLYRKYCSIECRSNALTISKDKVIDRIKEFHKVYMRIPVKREMLGIYKPARKYFKTWNNAIEAAGFKPNPILFAGHQVANDGHICDSLAEKLIDDYLFERSISHERNIPYPEGTYTADFKIGDRIIEYFGLAGEHTRYDELRRIKKSIVKKHKLNLIEVYPKDLYPHNKLEEVLAI